MRRIFVGALAVLALAGAASADVVSTSLFVPAGGIGSIVGGPVIAGSRFHAFNFGTSDDTVMRILDPGATVVASNDDGGPDANSGVSFTPTITGNYTFEVSRFPDFGFTGNTGAAFTTTLVACNGATGADAGGNDTYLTSQAAVYGLAGFAMSGSLTAGDVDFYAFNAVAGQTLGAYMEASTDTVLGLFDASGALLTFNDDGANGTASAMQFTVPASGTYYLAVSAFDDFGFTGLHGRSGDYLLIVAGGSAVPAPGAAAMLGLAGLAGLRRRR